MAHARQLTAPDWQLWRELRLRALADDDGYRPALEVELEFTESEWRERVAEKSAAKFAGGSDIGVHDGILAAFLHVQEPVTELYSMWVAGPARRRGVACALLDAAAGWATAQGSEVLSLKVFVDNSAAQRLYRRFGFALTSYRGVHELTGRTELEMALELGTAG